MITARLPPKYIGALTAVARIRKKSRSRILSDAVERYLKEMYYNRAGDVIHLQELIRHVKEYLSLARMTVPVAGLPAKKRRDELEEVMWKAVQDAVQYAKTEEAARNAEKRLWALMVVARLAQVHNAILRDQDRSYVDDLLELIEADLDEPETETKTRAAKKART
jgi:hypothetical protein